MAVSFSDNSKMMMNKPADSARDGSHESAIDIRFGQVGLVQVRIRTTDPGVILDELTGRIATAPRFFERTAVCLDLSALERSPDVAEVRGVIDAVKRAGMLSIGLTTGSLGVEALSGALQIPVLSHFRAQNNHQPAPVPVVQPAPQPVETAGQPAMMHHQTVRSGQRIYARNRDLVVTATVGAGAEVMADGCVHIYGPLRGRAMAGTRDDISARVFCQEFHAELVSIAGVFRVFETVPADLAGKPVQAWLDGDKLHFARIGG
jgi:septum site-determining protein MinC